MLVAPIGIAFRLIGAPTREVESWVVQNLLQYLRLEQFRQVAPDWVSPMRRHAIVEYIPAHLARVVETIALFFANVRLKL